MSFEKKSEPCNEKLFLKLVGLCGVYLSGMFLCMILLKVLLVILTRWNPILLSYTVVFCTMTWNFILINLILLYNLKEQRNV